MPDEPATQATPKGKTEAMRTLDERWSTLLETLDGIPADRAAETGACGKWSVKDLVAHIAFWDGQAEISAQRQALGEPPRELDWSALNEREAAASANRPYGEIWEELTTTHERVRAALSQLPALDPKAVGEDTFDHYEEHRAEIQAWRERAGI